MNCCFYRTTSSWCCWASRKGSLERGLKSNLLRQCALSSKMTPVLISIWSSWDPCFKSSTISLLQKNTVSLWISSIKCSQAWEENSKNKCPASCKSYYAWRTPTRKCWIQYNYWDRSVTLENSWVKWSFSYWKKVAIWNSWCACSNCSLENINSDWDTSFSPLLIRCIQSSKHSLVKILWLRFLSSCKICLLTYSPIFRLFFLKSFISFLGKTVKLLTHS